MTGKRVGYRSYLLRLWFGEPERPCHASLQSTSDQQIHHFPNLEALLAFLHEHIEGESTTTQIVIASKEEDEHTK